MCCKQQHPFPAQLAGSRGAASPLPLGLAARSSSADMPMVLRLSGAAGPGQGCGGSRCRFLSRSSRAPQGLIVFPQPRSGRQERGAEGRGDTGRHHDSRRSGE